MREKSPSGPSGPGRTGEGKKEYGERNSHRHSVGAHLSNVKLKSSGSLVGGLQVSSPG